MEVQTGKSEKNAGQVGQGDILGSAQQVLGQSNKVSTPTQLSPPFLRAQISPSSSFPEPNSRQVF